MLAGMGGAGKTQLVAEFARLMWDTGQVDLLVWITAAAQEAIVSSYATAAVKIGQSAGERDDQEASDRFLEWLAATDRRWLIVLDDVQKPSDLRGLWPPRQLTGRVVVTTRRRDAALTRRGHLIEVGTFTAVEATAYLRTKLADSSASADGAAELAAELGYLPVALAQAAAYLTDRKLTCAAYLQRFVDQRRRLHEVVPEPESLPDDHRATLAATWSLSMELADQLAPAGLALPVLELAAVLDPNGIPDAVLTAPAVLEHLATRLGAAEPVEAEDVREALHGLNRLSLVIVDSDDPHRSVRIHELVQRSTRDRLGDEQLAIVAHAAADALMSAWPQIERDTEYGQVLRTNTDTLHRRTRLWHPVLSRAGNSRGAAGRVTEAAEYFTALRSHAMQRLGPDHPDTLAIRHNLACWHGESGDTAGAVGELEDLLTDRSRVLGVGHIDTLYTRHELARFREAVGDVAKAVAEYEQLLAESTERLGQEHIDTLTTRHNLAYLKGSTEEGGAAIVDIEGLLADECRSLGSDHFNTLSTRRTLANQLGKVGDVMDAIAKLEELLVDQFRVLGPYHPRTLMTRNDVAYWRGKSGDAAGAVAEFQELYADESSVLGPSHPDVLITRHNLAYWRGRVGDAKGAVAELQDVLSDQSRVLSPDHPSILSTRHSLAHWRGEAGDAAGAVDGFATLLADRLRVLGSEHPDTRRTRDDLARWQGDAGDVNESGK
ncbi:hypothetical protein GCM10027271_01470 [Saccharopolyspora gloriosae]